MNFVSIDGKKIGDGNPCFVVAEAGSNHNGKFALAKKLIDKAVEAKADAVKFQVFRAKKLYAENSGKADYLKSKKTIFQIIKEMEMPYGWIPKLMAYCKKKGIIFMAAAFDEESADILEKNGITSYKIASYELTHHPLLEHIAKKNKPIVLSTGLASMKEIKQAIEVIKKAGNKKIVLMQCIAAYPAPVEVSNLKSIAEMKKKFNVPAGMSDHSRNHLIVPIASTAIGGNIVEKHFTLDNKMGGPDHKFAVEPHELKEMIEAVRQTEKALGNGKKIVSKEEKELFNFARRSIFAVKKINSGEIFSTENIAVLRSGKLQKGLEPKYFGRLIGKKAKILIEKNQPITKKNAGDFY